MKTVTKNLTLFGGILVAGLALFALRHAHAVTPLGDTGSNLLVSVKAGENAVFNKKHMEKLTWSVKEYSGNLQLTEIAQQAPNSKKFENKTYITFKTLEPGLASFTIQAINPNQGNKVVQGHEKTFTFNVK